jgi:hypothetical protein
MQVGSCFQRHGGRPDEKVAQFLLRCEQFVDVLAQPRLVATRLFQVGGSLGRFGDVQRRGKDGALVHVKNS